MSFSVSFFARDVHTARAKLHEAHAPAGVKALVELAIAGISATPQQNDHAGAGSSSHGASGTASQSVNRASPAPRRLCGILVETHGHIDEGGGRSNIGGFRVDPYWD